MTRIRSGFPRLTVRACGALAGLALLAGAAQSPVPAEARQFHLFLLAGQSNMAGRGQVGAQDRVPHPRVLMLDRARSWVPAVDPMHFDKPVAGVGLGRTFARRIAEELPDVTIGLVPAAVGGSPIDSWQPGAYYEPTKSHPWDDAIARARAAMSRGTLRAILWHQGESDATAALAPAYEAKLEALVERFRSTLGQPDLPFIVGGLGRFAESPWDEHRTTIDAVHRRLPARVPHTAYVSSDGLTHGGDRLHFDSGSLRTFGERYARAYRELVGER